MSDPIDPDKKPEEEAAPPPPAEPATPPPAAEPPPAASTTNPIEAKNKEKLPAGLLAILLGAFGIHKFYLGYQKEGIIMLVVTLAGGAITCGAASGVMSIIGIVEGVMYLTKSDEEFQNIYVKNQKPWF